MNGKYFLQGMAMSWALSSYKHSVMQILMGKHLILLILLVGNPNHCTFSVAVVITRKNNFFWLTKSFKCILDLLLFTFLTRLQDFGVELSFSRPNPRKKGALAEMNNATHVLIAQSRYLCP